MRKSHIYIERQFVGPDDEVDDPTSNACYNILDKWYADLPEAAQEEFDAVEIQIRTDRRRVRDWAPRFREAWENGDPLPTLRFGHTVTVDTSKVMGSDDLASMPKAYLAVLESGRRGVTSLEARKHGEMGGGISGSLSKLHRYGVVARLKETR